MNDILTQTLHSNLSSRRRLLTRIFAMLPLLLLPMLSYASYSTKISAQPGNGSFSIAIPSSGDNQENRSMQHKTKYDQFCTYTSFGPFATDFSVFRVQVCKKSVPLTPAIVHGILYAIISQTAAAYKVRNFKVISHDMFNLNGHKAYYLVYTQHVPGRFVLKNLGAESGEMQTQAIYVVDYNKYLVVFNVQTSNASSINKINASNRSKITKRLWKSQNKFVNSFRLYP